MLDVQKPDFRSNSLLVWMIVGVSAAIVCVLAVSAQSWWAQSALIQQELSGTFIKPAEAAQIDAWHEWLWQFMAALYAVAFVLVIVWAVRAARNARVLTGSNIRVTIGTVLLLHVLLHKLLHDLWLAGTLGADKPNRWRRIPWPLVVCFMLLVASKWPLSHPDTLTRAIDLPPRLRCDTAAPWRRHSLERNLGLCRDEFAACFIRMLAAAVLVGGIVWIDQLHMKKWQARLEAETIS
jgi:hypothetical protein